MLSVPYLNASQSIPEQFIEFTIPEPNESPSESSTLKHPAHIKSPQPASLPIELFDGSEDEQVENSQLDEEGNAIIIMDYADLGKR